VDLSDLVGSAGVVEDSLRRRRLTRVDVRGDADIADGVECVTSGHGFYFRFRGLGAAKKELTGSIFAPANSRLATRSTFHYDWLE
jgi:hypothetical protein